MAQLISATAARRHLLQLQTARVPIGQIARRTDISLACLIEIANGTRREIPAQISHRIVAVSIRSHSPGSLISARGAQRRIQALHAMGWSAAAIAHHLGWGAGQVSGVLRAKAITRLRHERVSAAFDRLWDQQPSDSTDAAHARTLAIANSWPSPLAWDDIDADDAPAVTGPLEDYVDEVAVLQAVNGHAGKLSHAEILAADALLVHAQVDSIEIARRLGISRANLYRIRAANAVSATAETASSNSPSNEEICNPVLERTSIESDSPKAVAPREVITSPTRPSPNLWPLDPHPNEARNSRAQPGDHHQPAVRISLAHLRLVSRTRQHAPPGYHDQDSRSSSSRSEVVAA